MSTPSGSPPAPPDPRPEAEPTIGITPEERRIQLAHAAAAHALDRSLAGAPEIPGYRIVRVVAVGGMGTVYEAEQRTPRRVVALKVIRAGEATPELIARLEHEAHILGLFQHPGIAQIYEAGLFDSPEGPRPYLAMELIRGLSLTRHAKERGLTTRERAALLIRVCEAVQHAHERGVIHRDLKPDNILVDETGTPKVVDFGVARARRDALAGESMGTKAGTVLGTVSYMSPEQLTGRLDEVDARSDVYSLGVIGYQLFARRLPIDFGTLTLIEAARAMSEIDPPSLSSADRSLRGDLVTVMGRALEKDRRRRYQGAGELARDLRRYLDNEPVAARRPTALYQAQKRLQRNRPLAAGLGAAFLLLLCGMGATFWQARRAAIERDSARAARELARREEATAERVASFLVDIFDQSAGAADYRPGGESGPADPAGREVTAHEILDEGARRIAVDLANEPEIQAGLMRMIGNAYMGINEAAAAVRMHRGALERWRGLPGRVSAEVVTELHCLGEALIEIEAYEEAVRIGEEALAAARSIAPEDSPLVGEAIQVLGSAWHKLGSLGKHPGALDEAILHGRGLVDRLRRLGEVGDVNYAASINNLARSLDLKLKAPNAEIESLYLESLDIARRLAPGTVATAIKASNLAGYYLDTTKEYRKAESLYREALDIMRTRPWSSLYLDSLKNLAVMLTREGRDWGEAENLYGEYVRIFDTVIPGERIEKAWGQESLAKLLMKRGAVREANALFKPSIDLQLRLRPQNPDLPRLLELYLSGLLMVKDFDEADAMARRQVEIYSREPGPGTPRHAAALLLLSRLEMARGNREEARRLRAEAASVPTDTSLPRTGILSIVPRPEVLLPTPGAP